MRLLLLVLVAFCLASPTLAADVWTEPYPGLRYLHRSTSEPKEIHAVVVDLDRPGVRLRATRRSEKGQTVSAFASAVGAAAAINADFFDGALNPIGLAIGEGERWQDDRRDWYALACSRDNACTLETNVGVIGDGVHTAVSGKNVLVAPGFVFSANDDSACGDFCTVAHPRTAAGLSADGRQLILVVVEGRQTPILGMRLSQLARLMVELGAARAVNLDGGGSSAMVVAGARVSGRPANEPGERRVANHLAVVVEDEVVTTGRLVGFVREGRVDATDRPVADAIVTLDSGATTTTDSRGFYEFATAPTGPARVTASKDGFDAVTITRDVARATTTWGSIALQPTPPDADLTDPPADDPPADDPPADDPPADDPPADDPPADDPPAPVDPPTDDPPAPVDPPTEETGDDPTAVPDLDAGVGDDNDVVDDDEPALPKSVSVGCTASDGGHGPALLVLVAMTGAARRRRSAPR
jgi:MYXO-CTERM domain-containing protein